MKKNHRWQIIKEKKATLGLRHNNMTENPSVHYCLEGVIKLKSFLKLFGVCPEMHQ